MYRALRLLAILAGLLLSFPIGSAAGQSLSGEIVLESSVMNAGETMPRDYTPDGRNVSPPLSWSGLPDGTRELALVCADFGAGNPPPWVHWIIYSIPPTASGLPEGLPIEPHVAMPAVLAGAIQGLNGWRRPYYRGPAPPAGTPHLYHFTLYALDRPLGLDPGLSRRELLEAIEGHVLGRGELVQVYERFSRPANE